MATKFSDVGALCASNGWTVLPICPTTKRPGWLAADGTEVGLGGWTNYAANPPTEGDLRQWSSVEAGVGLLCGDIVAIDIDVSEPALSAEIEARVRRLCGNTIKRVGNAPKCLLVYRAVGIIRSTSHVFVVDGVKHQVDVLCSGRQFVAYATHSKTGLPYEWHGGSPADVAIDQLPYIRQEHVLEIIAGLPSAPPQMELDNGARPESADERSVSIEALDYVVRHLPNNCGWDEWIRVGFAIYNSTPNCPQRGWEIFHEFSSRHPHFDEFTTRSNWRSFSVKNDRKIQFGTLVDMARKAGIAIPPNISFRDQRELPDVDIDLLLESVPQADRAPGLYVDPLVIPAADDKQKSVIDGIQYDYMSDEWLVAAEADLRRQAVERSIRANSPISSGQESLVSFGRYSIDMAPKKCPITPPEIVTLPPGGGLIGSFMQWYCSTASIPIAQYGAAAGLALVATLAGRAFRTQTNLRPNLYFAIIGDTGCGKNHPQACLTSALAAAGIHGQHMIGSNMFSGNALQEEFIRAAGTGPKAKGSEGSTSGDGTSMSKLSVIDEFGSFWSQGTGKNSSASAATLFGTLMTLFSKSNEVLMGPTKVGHPPSSIPYPALTIFGATTAASFFEATSKQQLAQGHVNRILLMETREVREEPLEKHRAKFVERERMEIPELLLDSIKALSNYCSDKLPLCGSVTTDYADTIKMSDDALDAMAEIDKVMALCGIKASRHQGLESKPFSRISELTAKVALVSAISRGAKRFEVNGVGRLTLSNPNFQITLADVDWAFRIVKFSTERFAYALAGEVGGSDQEQDIRELEKILHQAGSAGHPIKGLKSRLGKTEQRYKNALAMLVDASRVALGKRAFERKRLGRPAKGEKGAVATRDEDAIWHIDHLHDAYEMGVYKLSSDDQRELDQKIANLRVTN